jgi:hypothetical protein
MAAEPYDSAALAADAMQRQAERKRRRGYSFVHFPSNYAMLGIRKENA